MLTQHRFKLINRCASSFVAVQVVQGASEPGGRQAAGGNGWLCPRVPGTFSQPAGEHADQDQSRRWVKVISEDACD